MDHNAVKNLLDRNLELYYNDGFLSEDPLQIPHKFSQKEDIEIAALLTATIAWGQRKTIINNAERMMSLMDDAPYDFILHHQESDLKVMDNFVHRTFNGADLRFFVAGLKHIYSTYNGLETVFHAYSTEPFLHKSIHHFRQCMFETPHEKRSEKHISDPLNKSAAKRIHMFLRWMVRPCERGVDFGLWTTLSPAQLSCPLDVHTGNVARSLGLISRKTNDIIALGELDKALRSFDHNDPVKYDFALFGIGVHKDFS
jgi:uncharacterized protein (TIGR02757 family)